MVAAIFGILSKIILSRSINGILKRCLNLSTRLYISNESFDSEWSGSGFDEILPITSPVYQDRTRKEFFEHFWVFLNIPDKLVGISIPNQKFRNSIVRRNRADHDLRF